MINRTIGTALLIAFSVVVSMLFASSALAANGACGGGNTLSQAMKGWQKHGVLDNVASSTGQTPGLDGSARSIVKGGIVKTIVVRGGYVTNFTCRGGEFKKLKGKKYIPAGSIYWVPEKYAPAPCKKGRTKRGYEARCGNKQVGNLLVKRPCKRSKPPKPPKPPAVPPVCDNSQTNTSNSGSACQGNNGKNDAEVNNDCKGPNYNSSQCNVVINQTIIQINANCSKVIVNYGDGSTSVTFQDSDGNVVTESYCSTTTPPPPPPVCPDGTPVPPSGVCNTPPRIRDDRNTAHTMVGDHRTVWFVATDDQGDVPGVPQVQPVGHSYATILIDPDPVSTIGSGHTCPAGSVCHKGELWVYSVPPGTTATNPFFAPFRVRTIAGGQWSEWYEFTQPLIPAIL